MYTWGLKMQSLYEKLCSIYEIITKVIIISKPWIKSVLSLMSWGMEKHDAIISTVSVTHSVGAGRYGSTDCSDDH